MTDPMPHHDERRYQRRADRLRCARQDARQQRAADERAQDIALMVRVRAANDVLCRRFA